MIQIEIKAPTKAFIILDSLNDILGVVGLEREMPDSCDPSKKVKVFTYTLHTVMGAYEIDQTTFDALHTHEDFDYYP